MRPVSGKVCPNYPAVPTPTKIDALVVAKLRKLGVVPSEVCTDAEFLRRVSLDLTGTLPTPTEVEAFAADRSPDKQARKIDELLERPTYAARWTTKLCDITGNSPRHFQDQAPPEEDSAVQSPFKLRPNCADFIQNFGACILIEPSLFRPVYQLDCRQHACAHT